VLPNYYPYWEGVNVTQAVATLHLWHQQILSAAGNKPVIVSETGWPSAGNQIGEALPSPENAAYYFLNFESWAKAEGVSAFYFEAFGEPWKIGTEGPQGAHWGLWDDNRTLKPGMQAVFDGDTVPDNWSGNAVVGGPGTPTIQFSYVPPYGSNNNLNGQVAHVRPVDCKVAVFIKVGGGWWNKPTWAAPLTDIRPDGSWTCDITTGGSDSTATEIAAYLVPVGYTPPQMSGQATFPTELGVNAIANCHVTRSP
jgi:hypothetical protein